MRTLVLAGSLAVLATPALAQSAFPPPAAPPASHDGSHDFDFNTGVWKTHMVRRAHPLTGSADTFELNGTVTIRKVWDGRARLEEIEAEGPKGHWEGLTLFLYDPKAQQWSTNFANSASGQLVTPFIGRFTNGRGELVEADTLDGRAILVRSLWSDITPTTHHYQESYSGDGGKTWEVELTAELTVLADAAPPRTKAAFTEGSHDFDFDLGTWRTKTSRLKHPLSGSNEWMEMDGKTTVAPVWGGKANIAEFESDGPEGHLELLSLRLFDPSAKQWSLNFATSAVGQRSVPMVGEFKDGRGVFYDQEQFNGRSILVRFQMIPISANEARSEQAFSADGGKTWETNWINRYTRIAP